MSYRVAEARYNQCEIQRYVAFYGGIGWLNVKSLHYCLLKPNMSLDRSLRALFDKSSKTKKNVKFDSW